TLATEWRPDGYETYLLDFVGAGEMIQSEIGQPAADQRQRFRITLDGPSASGKSAAGSRVAARLGYPFVDTGSMYRAVTWLALQRGVDPAAAEALTALAESASIAIGPPPADGRETGRININGRGIPASLSYPVVGASGTR